LPFGVDIREKQGKRLGEGMGVKDFLILTGG